MGDDSANVLDYSVAWLIDFRELGLELMKRSYLGYISCWKACFCIQKLEVRVLIQSGTGTVGWLLAGINMCGIL